MPQRKITSKVSFIATFEKGVIKQTQYSILTLLKYEPTKIAVTVEPIGSTRSFNQLAYYWGIVLPEVARHTGNSATELHDVLNVYYCHRDHEIPGQRDKDGSNYRHAFERRDG